MEESVCPRCQSSKYRNPNLKLLVNVCGHSLCQDCVDLTFAKGSGNCPVCSIPLRKGDFRVQIFEDASVEKEVQVRKRVLRDLNVYEEDFQSLQEYNDFTELRETIVFKLVNGVELASTKRQIEDLKRQYRDEIARNRSKLSRAQQEIEDVLQTERAEDGLRRVEFLRADAEVQRGRVIADQMLIDQLATSDESAHKIVADFKQKAVFNKPQPIKQSEKRSAEPCRATPAAKPYHYIPPIAHKPNGPVPPTPRTITSRGIDQRVPNVRTDQLLEACGFSRSLAAQRLLQQAFDSLCLSTGGDT